MDTENITRTVKKDLNPGLAKRQKDTRERNAQLIKDTIEDMREAGQQINYSTLAQESGLSRQTLYKPHIKALLQTYPEFSEDVKLAERMKIRTPEEQLQMALLENNKLREKLGLMQERVEDLKMQLDEKKRELARERTTSEQLREQLIKQGLDSLTREIGGDR